jgi:GntR family transcriptional regulator/MocR family aminotransferase
MNEIQIDANRDEPVYRQIFDHIVLQIRSGRLAPGTRLPPTRTLARRLRTHRNTVVHAYEQLASAGFVSAGVGRGTFVNQLQRPAPPGPPREGRPIAWELLLSSGPRSEPLRSLEHFSAGGAARDQVNLSRMEPASELLPVELFQRCLDHSLRSLGPRALGYGPREGVPRLRRLLAEDLRRRGLQAEPEEILVTTGSQQALDLLARALLDPGDTVLVDASTYTGAIRVLAAAGARIVGVPGDGDGPDLAALERPGGPAAKFLYLMPDCNNPTGACISAERREALLRWSQEAGVPLVEDDYAADLRLEPEPPPAALRSMSRDVPYIGTFSKKLIPALRFGFLLCPPGLLGSLAPLKQAMDLGTSALLQHALAEFLERGYLEPHLGRGVAEYRRRRDALEAALAEHLPPELRWRHPEQGVVLWLPLPPDLEPRQLFEEARREGVLVSPSPLFGVDGRREHGLRLTFCAEPPERLAEGARRLGRAVARLRAGAREAVLGVV